MDDRTFDGLARFVAAPRTRRGAATLVAGGLIAGVGAGTEARRKRVRCERGLTRCRNTCSDTTSDTDNCGRCRHVCPSGDVCVDSECVLPEE